MGSPIGFWVHGYPAHSLEQVVSFLTGDAHDQSKVQWYDGKRFHSIGFKDFPTDFTTVEHWLKRAQKAADFTNE